MTDLAKKEKDLIAQKLWSSKDLWKAVTGVALAVFVLTSIYGRFIFLEKDNVQQKDLHATDIKNLKDAHEVEMKNLRESLEAQIFVIADRQTKQHARQDEDIKTLQKMSHERGK